MEVLMSEATGSQFFRIPSSSPVHSLRPHLAVTEEVQAQSQQKAALGQLQFQWNWTTCYPETSNLTPNPQSQLWLLALVAWEVEAT